MTTAELNKQKVKDFFKHLEEGNAPAVAELFAEDGNHVNPYASGLFPEGVTGRKAIKNYWQEPGHREDQAYILPMYENRYYGNT